MPPYTKRKEVMIQIVYKVNGESFDTLTTDSDYSIKIR